MRARYNLMFYNTLVAGIAKDYFADLQTSAVFL